MTDQAGDQIDQPDDRGGDRNDDPASDQPGDNGDSQHDDPPPDIAAVPARSTLSPATVVLVADREVRALLQKRSFWVGASMALALVMVIATLPGLLSGDSTTERTIGLTGSSTAMAAPLRAADRADDDLTVEVRSYDSDRAARRAARDGDVDAAVVGEAILVDDDADPEVVALLDQAARVALVDEGVKQGTVERSAARTLSQPRVLTVRALDPKDPEESARQAMTIFGIFLLFAQVFAFGYTVAGSIVEEKSSRVVEVLLSRIRATELLAGKVVGVLVTTTAQVVVYAAVGLVCATLTGSLDLPPGWPGVIGTLVGWYLVAYVFFAAVFAIAGSLAASPEELQSSAMPATLLVMVGYGAAFAALSDPDGPVAIAGSFFPSSAPLVMPLRTVAGDVGAGEIALSVAVTLGIGVLLVFVAARIYRGSVLKTRRTGLRDAWRAARA